MGELIQKYKELIERLDKACEWLRVNRINDIEDVRESMPKRYNSYQKLISQIEEVQMKIHKGEINE